MAFSQLYVCDTCQSDIVLVHAEEWQPGQDTGKNTENPVPYPGYGPVGGLLNRLWCPGCAAVRPHIFVRLDPPGNHPVVAYAEAQRLGCTGDETGPCPVCGELLTWDADGIPCPTCTDGHLRFTGEWEDAV
jgi:hypothetical protein